MMLHLHMCLVSSPPPFLFIVIYTWKQKCGGKWGRPGSNVITTVTTTCIPCCLVCVVKLCHWAVEHLQGKSGISNDTILSQLHLMNIESSNNGIITCTELVSYMYILNKF